MEDSRDFAGVLKLDTKIMELDYLKDVHVGFFIYLTVNKLKADKVQNILFNCWTFWLHKIYL